MSEDDIVNLSFDIDDALSLLGKQYGISPFVLTSVVLARLAAINRQTGELVEWNKLVRKSLNVTENIIETSASKYH